MRGVQFIPDHLPRDPAGNASVLQPGAPAPAGALPLFRWPFPAEPAAMEKGSASEDLLEEPAAPMAGIMTTLF
jgi:hypothetical protein